MRLLLIFLCLVCPPALAQGFAGLGTQADGFAVPERGTAFSFPADHGPHPAYRIEWWYLTALLEDAEGTAYGLQWTLFRSALRPGAGEGWRSSQLWMGHAAVTTPDAHFVSERLARGGVGQADVQVSREFDAWIDDWAMTGSRDLNRLDLRARGADFSYEMALNARGPLIFHGEDGYSQKSPAGQASYYYSQPFYDIAGVLDLPDGEVRVTGTAWLDREWSSQPLSESQSGWDWFSLSFDSGARLMGFQLRGEGAESFSAATWIAPDGTTQAYNDGIFSAEPLEHSEVAGRRIPTRWRLRHSERGVDVEIAALNPQSWMATSVPYWEGPISITGSHAGRGYLEMTGY